MTFLNAFNVLAVVAALVAIVFALGIESRKDLGYVPFDGEE